MYFQGTLGRIPSYACFIKTHPIVKAFFKKSRASVVCLASWILAYPNFILAEESFKDYATSIQAAQAGNPNAQYNLGRFFLDGRGVVKDPKQAVKWFRTAAEQNLAKAQYTLGHCYDNGAGVEKDPKQAVEWYRKAAKQGDYFGQNAIGSCYMRGAGVEINPKQAVEWFHKAAEQNFAKAQYNLGFCYQNGIGVTKDSKESARWYRMASDQGDAQAAAELAKLASIFTIEGLKFIDPEPEKFGGPPTKDVVELMISRYGRFLMGSDQNSLEISVKRGNLLKIDEPSSIPKDTTIYPIRITYIHASGAGMVTTDYYFFKDSFDTWAVLLAPGSARPLQVP